MMEHFEVIGIGEQLRARGLAGKPFFGNVGAVRSGIYLVYFPDDDSGYVGQSFDMRGRLTAHLGNRSFRGNHPLRVKMKKCGHRACAFVLSSVTAQGRLDLADELCLREKACIERARAVFGERLINQATPGRTKLGRSWKAIEQVDAVTGAVVATFSSAQEAGRSVGLTTGRAISNCCAGTRPGKPKPFIHVCGWWWRLAGSKTPPPTQSPGTVAKSRTLPAETKKLAGKSRPLRFDAYSGEVVVFETFEEAASSVNWNAGRLRAVCGTRFSNRRGGGYGHHGRRGGQYIWLHDNSVCGQAVLTAKKKIRFQA